MEKLSLVFWDRVVAYIAYTCHPYGVAHPHCCMTAFGGRDGTVSEGAEASRVSS